MNNNRDKSKKRYEIKKAVSAIMKALTGALIVVIVNVEIVYAGDINGNEAGVLAAAQGTFEYEGKKYAAKSEYVDQLRSKLSQDGVDLTAVQASEAIAAIYGNVATGISKGYIVEITDNVPDNTEDTSGNPDNTTDNMINQNNNQIEETTVDNSQGQNSDETSKAEENKPGDSIAKSVDGQDDTDKVTDEKIAEKIVRESDDESGSGKEEKKGDADFNNKESAKADLSNMTKRKKVNKFIVTVIFALAGVIIVGIAVMYSKKHKR